MKLRIKASANLILNKDNCKTFLEVRKMAEIKITELRPIGSELFEDSETFLKELNDDEMTVTLGGGDSLLSISADTVDKSFISVGGDVSISK
jgi:hypothetical protein